LIFSSWSTKKTKRHADFTSIFSFIQQNQVSLHFVFIK
jgi:hypothetical protein